MQIEPWHWLILGLVLINLASLTCSLKRWLKPHHLAVFYSPKLG